MTRTETAGMPANRQKTGSRGPSPSVGKATQFKKDDPRINRTGRPKSKHLYQALRIRLEEGEADSIADALIRKAKRGNVQAAKEVGDRTEGKPAQILRHEGGDQPIRVVVLPARRVLGAIERKEPDKPQWE